MQLLARMLIALLTVNVLTVSRVDADFDADPVVEFVSQNCLDCHAGDDAERGFDLSDFGDRSLSDAQAVVSWEKALLRIQSRQMPPAGDHSLDDSELETVEQAMKAILDAHADESPYAGKTLALRRLTRTEYQNSIRDLLGIEFDVRSLLPADPSSDGFDNITVGDLSPLALERYLTAAQRVSRAAIGVSVPSGGGITVRVPADQSQEKHVAGLPFGTRGGTIVRYHFPREGEYEVQVRLTRDRDEKIEGLNEEHQLDILIDRKRGHRFTVKPPRGGKDYSTLDANLNVRLYVTAGSHDIGVTFVEKSTSISEIKRQPFDASYNRHRHPRRTPAIHEVSIVGPFATYESLMAEPAKRRNLFPDGLDFENAPRASARTVFASLLRKAYRREVDESDFAIPLRFFDDAFESSGKGVSQRRRFDVAIEAGLTSILVNPNFLFRSHRQPKEVEAGQLYQLPPGEVASRLSYFLWSSLPDEALLEDAESERLANAATIERHVRRMLKDARSGSLVDSFVDQWLYLRNLPTITPDLRKFPSFDNNLRGAFAEETRHLFRDLMARDASVLELIRSGHTFLNERLATHYGVPNVVGSHFRRVDLRPEWHRGGLLRHGSVLMATSYATRTSPTIRGSWVLENIVGTPPPPPPPNVPEIEKKKPGEELSFREMLAEHRDNVACASCHDLIDPVGFALDQYDAVGRYRETIEGIPVDASGKLPDGKTVNGVGELEEGILGNPELFVMVLTKKLMTYGIGRTLTEADGAAVRRVVANAAPNYRLSDLIVGITLSTPFRMRTAQ